MKHIYRVTGFKGDSTSVSDWTLASLLELGAVEHVSTEISFADYRLTFTHNFKAVGPDTTPVQDNVSNTFGPSVPNED